MSAVTTEAQGTPYRGLAAFGESEADALLFFGRERETEIVSANVLASRLTVLYGPSGVGKSSLLRAGVARKLRSLAEGEPLIVAVFSSWGGDPHEGIAEAARAAVAEALGREPETVAEGTLADQLGAWAGELGGDICLILDQLEELFLYHGGTGSHERFATELAEVVMRPGLRVTVLLGIREDALARLDAFKAHIPSLFANYLRLEHLDRASARAAVEGPLARWNQLSPQEGVEIEPALVDAVLDQVAAGRIDPGLAGRGGIDREEDPGRVEAAYLQLVLQRLWDVEGERASRTMRRSTLDDLGGAQRIVEDHLDRAMQALTPRQQDAAASMFDHLVTPSGTKIAHELGDLANYSHALPIDLEAVVRHLAHERILRPLAENGGAPGRRYEIFHDVLADAVLAWRTRHEAERTFEVEREQARTRQRRLFAVAAIAVLALGAMTIVAAYALSQRSEAHEQERSARARELSSRALVQLDVDPRQSLAWALEAAELEPTEQTETVLRRALLESRLRRVLPVGAAVPVLAYSPAGSYVLIGKASGGALIWDVARRRVVRRFAAGRGPVVAAAYDKSGEQVVVARGATATVWDVASGRRVATVRHSAAIADASFGADGERLVTASADGTVRVIAVSSGEPLQVLHQTGSARRAALSPDGRMLVVSMEDGEGRVRSSLYRGTRLVRILDERGVADVEFSANGSVLATSNYDGTTHLWNPRTGEPVRTLDDEGEAVVDVAFSPDGSFLATASSDGGVRVWRVDTGDRFFYFLGHTSPLRRVVFDPTGMFVVSTSVDKTARVWQVASIEAGKQVALLVGHGGAVLTAAVSPDGHSIVTGGADGTARVWDAHIEQRLDPIVSFPVNTELGRKARIGRAEFGADGRSVLASADPGGAVVVNLADRTRKVLETEPILDAAVSPDGGLIATVASGGKTRLLKPDGTVVATIPGEPADVRFAPDGERIALGASVWRVPSGDPVARLRHARDAVVTETALSGGFAVTGDHAGVARIWDLDRGRVLHELRGHRGRLSRIRISPGADVIASAGLDGTARLWGVDGRLLHVLRGHGGPLTDVRFDPTGRRVVTTGEGSEKNAMVWDVHSGRRLHDLVGHFGTVSTAQFSADGRWIVTAGPISAVIWRADTGRLLFYLRGHSDLLESASFSPRGYDVLTSARDGTVRTYRCEVCVPLDELVHLARRRLAAAD
jgi:WD40 repeat protein